MSYHKYYVMILQTIGLGINMAESPKKYKIYWDAKQKAPLILNTMLGEDKNYPDAKYMSTNLLKIHIEYGE